MAQPTTQLNATEQDTLVKQIGLALLRAAPRDWRRVSAQYRAVGRYHELTGEVLKEDGSVGEWMATHDIATLFGRLRGGMYREGRGTWFNARYQLDHPSSYNLEYDREEPRWDLQPPPQAYADELRTFPRSEENVPDWLMRRMSGLGPEQPGPRFRIARIFDGQGPDGRPVLNRPELDAEELDRLYEYLSTAPVVLSERGLDLDRLAVPPTPKVPVAFHSDGVWIWPAAINYYLQEYGIAPEGELVAHIQQTGFRLAEVPEQTLQAANAHLTRGNQPPPRPPRPAEQPAPPQAPQATEPQPVPEPETVFEEKVEAPPEPPVEHATTFTPMPDLDDGPPTMVQSPLPPAPEPEPEPERLPERMAERMAEPPQPPQHEPGPPPTMFVPPVAPPAPPEPRPEPRPAPPPALDGLRDRLKDLGVPDSAYRIGEPIEHGWSMEQVESGWRVGWYDEELSNPAVFGDPEDAAAFMLGKLMLDPRGREAAPTPPVPPVPAVPPMPPVPPVPPVEMDDTAPVNGGPSADRHRESLERHEEQAPPELPARVDLHTELPSRADLPSRAEPRADLPSRADVPSHAELPSRADLQARPEPPVRTEPPSPPAGEPRLEETMLDAPPTMLAAPVSPPPRREPPQQPPQQQPQRREPARSGAAQNGAGSQWPIQPMSGEPPLTLFRGKEMRELPAGSELDRFGGPNGNLLYAAGTPFEERSLVPEWVSRPYHVYRVQRPIDALAGVAIPWFNQPGGGAAYLLPGSVEELLAEGDLIELDPGEPPIE
ncbi:TNT domain-containing protein [Amycolatopsis sp. GM8]|uniref:TNT domain-containing protein n=1 Tax=Amycolatopsis sp. GM8 TaxID=2896530 RepID=UPI001F329F4F|nr:TNT domain-containing protein [Amycolatopsis sp. GM8]